MFTHYLALLLEQVAHLFLLSIKIDDFYLSNRAFMKVFSSNSVTKSFSISKHILVNLISSSQVLVYVIFLPSSRQLRHCGKYRNVKNLSFCL